MLQIMILEDSKEAMDALNAIICPCDESIRIFTASNRKQAEELLEKQSFGLFFLDVNLNAGNQLDAEGIEFAKFLRKISVYEFTPIVFITSMMEMELISYRETQCYRYITKPFDRNEIINIVMKVLSNQRKNEQPQVTIKKDGINYCIPVDEIVYIEAMPRGIILHMTNESLSVKYLSIKQIMEKLPSEYFIQCHRMFAINTHYVEYMDHVNRLIKMKGYDQMVEIGVTYKSEIRRIVHG